MKNLPEITMSCQVIRQSGSPGSLHVFELSHERARDKKLLILAEIEVSDKDNEKIIEDIAREVEQQFFNAPTKETEYAFENALAKANIKIKDTLLAKPKNWLNRIHIAVLALSGSEVYLASVGSVHAFLTHREKIIDVLASPGAAASPNPVKLFTNIVTGKLGPDIAIVLANESVLDYLSIERIRKCAQESDAQEAVETLTELLSRAPSNKQFGLAVVAAALPRTAEARGTPSSRAEVHRAEPERAQDVEPYAEPYVSPEEPHYPSGQFDHGSSAMQALRKIAGTAAQRALTVLLSVLAKLLEALQMFVRRGVPALAAFAKTALTVARNTESRAYFFRRIKQAAGSTAYQQVLGQPKKRRLAGAGALLLIVVFIASVSVRARQQNQVDETARFQTSVAGIEQKVSEAEASLIYGNKIKSQTLLADSLAALAELSREFPGQGDRVMAIRDSIAALQARGEKRQPITGIKTIATAIPAPISPNATGLIPLGNSIYFYDGVGEKIASLDVQNALLLSLALTDQGGQSFNTALELSDTEIAALAADMIQIIDPSRETVAKQEFPFNPANAKPFASYARNLYTFNTETNQIVRYRRAGAGFTAAQDWLTEEYELATMQDIRVDGFVYLIDSQGTIHVFLRGSLNKTIPWPAQDLPGSFIRLYTREDLSVFYVLDPERERIVRINKDGSLEAQLTEPALQQATDLVADGEHQNLYVLAADKIYQLPVTQ
ncbi:MAG: hypothetical protein HYS45_01450 [Parcubacteria group bacterium]|nr:hypothetical protein [Parcubacteria group bacterium]